MKIEEKIKDYIEQLGMTKTELSILTGISLPKISLMFSGKRRLSLEEFSNICYVLDRKPNDFLTPEEPAFLKQCVLSM